MKSNKIIKAQPGYFLCETITDESGKYFMGFGYDPIIAWRISWDHGFDYTSPITINNIRDNWGFIKYPDGYYYDDQLGVGPMTEEQARYRMIESYKNKGVDHGQEKTE
jgi:hypothetical protein